MDQYRVMDALQERVTTLKVLATHKPRADRFETVCEALDDKFEGVQSVALKVLGAWGDAASIEQLRNFLINAFTRPYGWAIRGVAIDELVPHVKETDVDWILDLYFGLPDHLQQHELLWLVAALPPLPARSRLVSALTDSSRNNRSAAVKAIGNMDFEDRANLAALLLDDPDGFVRRCAQVVVNREAE